MSDNNLEKISVPNFFDPSLFWFIYEKDLDFRDELHRSLQRTMKKRSTTVLETSEKNAIGGVIYNDEWHRVQIKSFINHDHHLKIVHFIDQGFFERVEKVFTLPKVYVTTPPFCKKGMLYGVQQTKLEYDLRNTNLNRTKEWSDGIISKIQDIFADPDTEVKFKKVLDYENTEIGHIYINNPEDREINGCLTNYLVEKGCAIIDEDAFESDLLNQLSEKETIKKITHTYNSHQKRQRSKSVSHQKRDSNPNQKSPNSDQISRHRSTSESREITYRTVKNERKLILEKIGIQKHTNRQSRHQKFISEMENFGIVNDLTNGVEVPSQSKSSPKISRGRGKRINDESEDSNFSSSSFELVNEPFKDVKEKCNMSQTSEKSLNTSQSSLEKSNFASKSIVRGRGSKKVNAPSSDTSSDNLETKPSPTVSKLKTYLKKFKDSDRQVEKAQSLPFENISEGPKEPNFTSEGPKAINITSAHNINRKNFAEPKIASDLKSHSEGRTEPKIASNYRNDSKLLHKPDISSDYKNISSISDGSKEQKSSSIAARVKSIMAKKTESKLESEKIRSDNKNLTSEIPSDLKPIPIENPRSIDENNSFDSKLKISKGRGKINLDDFNPPEPRKKLMGFGRKINYDSSTDTSDNAFEEIEKSQTKKIMAKLGVTNEKSYRNTSDQLVFDLPSPVWSKKTPLNDSETKTFSNESQNFDFKEQMLRKYPSKSGNDKEFQKTYDLPSLTSSKKSYEFETENLTKANAQNFEIELSKRQNVEFSKTQVESTITYSKNFSCFSKGRGKMHSTPIVGNNFVDNSDSVSESSPEYRNRNRKMDFDSQSDSLSIPSSPEKTAISKSPKDVLSIRNLNLQTQNVSTEKLSAQNYSRDTQYDDFEQFDKICRGRGVKKTPSITSDSNFDFERNEKSLDQKLGFGRKNMKSFENEIKDSDSIFADKISVCSSSSEKPRSIFDGMTTRNSETKKQNRVQRFLPAGMTTCNSETESTKSERSSGIKVLRGSHQKFSGKNSDFSDDSDFKNKENWERRSQKYFGHKNYSGKSSDFDSDYRDKENSWERGPKKTFGHQNYSGKSSDFDSDYRNKENSWERGPQKKFGHQNSGKGSDFSDSDFYDRRPQNKFTKSGSEGNPNSNEKRDCLNPFLGRGCANTSKTNKNFNSPSSSQSDNAKKCLGNFKFDENEERNEKNYNTPSCVMSRLKTKHCLCDKCTTWFDTNELVWAENGNQNDQNQNAKPKNVKGSPKKRVIQPLLQNVNENFEKTPSENIYSSNKNGNFEIPKVLVHTPIALQRVERISESSFHPYVIESLRYLNYEKAHRIQNHSWCAIPRGLHTVLINGPQSGKSMAYIPPLCSEILYVENGAPDSYGPQILVIVPGAEIGDNIRTLMCKMYYKSPKKPRVHLAVPPLSQTTKRQIITGVDILVITPKILISLLKKKEIRLKRIKSVVLEEIDLLLKNFNDEIESVLHLLNSLSEKNALLDSTQLIIVGKHWTPPLESLVKRLKMPPAICIGAHLEAAIYGRVDINVKFIGSDEKDNYVTNLIKENQRSVIICNTSDEISALREVLKPYNPLFLDESCDIEAQKDVQSIWETPSKYRVLICNDLILNTDVFVNISDSSNVIQYALPESWTLFSKRFARFFKSFGSPIFETTSDYDTNKFKMHIFLDENSNVQYEKMVKFLQRFNKNLPKEILNLYDKIRREKELQKVVGNVEICDNIKLFGECFDSESCSFRHTFDDRDTLNNLPKSGIIKLKILHMHDITHYSVRLIQHIDSENQTHDIKDRFTEIQMKLTKLSNEEYRRPLTNVTVGSIGAIEESAKVFRRVIVTKILATTSSNVATKVQVKLMDMGAYYQVRATDLLALPQKELYNIPPQSVDVFIADMGPPDSDTVWSDVARIRLEHLLKQADYEGPNCYFTGRIKLQLCNTLWVNNLILREYVPDGSLKVHKFSAQPILLRSGLAEMRVGIMEKLYKLCENAGIVLPDYNLPVIKVAKEISPQVTPNWAHLENGQEYNPMFFCAADSPNRFFLRLAKNTSNFDHLIDDIQKAIRQPLYPTEFQVVEGRCYLAKDPDGDQYARVLVQQMDNENDIVHCFFVDHGDYITVQKSELKFLTDDLIFKLPFQVIECSLYGLKSEDEEKILDKLYDLAYEPDSNDLRTLYVKFIEKESPEVTTANAKYSVILIDSLNDYQIINDIFVESGLASKTVDLPFAEFLNVETFKLECLYEPPEMNSDDSDNEFSNLVIEDISGKEGSSGEVLGAEGDALGGDSDGKSFGSIEKIDLGEGIKNDFIDEYGTNFGLDINLDEFDIVCTDFKTFIADGFKDYKTQPYISRDSKSEYLAIQGPSTLTPQEFSTPNAVWSQTETHVIIKVKLTGVTDYTVHITRNKIFTFSTNVNDQFYKLIVTLYGRVESTPEHDAKGFYVYVKLKKSVPTDWERLNSGKQKLRNINYDPDALANEKEKPAEKVEIPFLFDEKLKPKYVYEYGSDADYDDSDPNSYDSDS